MLSFVGRYLRLNWDTCTNKHTLQIPRVMADLRAALGRGRMTSSEAKAWVEELDRLGEGLGRDGLRKDYPVR